jgi:hypothetical protein
LDDYSTVYLFFQWLRLQSLVEGEAIYKNIIASPYSDYRAVTGAAVRAMPGEGYAEWPVLLKTWLAANYINAPSGPYGYKNDSLLKDVRAKFAPNGTTSLDLLPGEGVYSMYNNKGDISDYGSGSGNIKYAGLTKSGEGAVDDNSIPSDGALLTYNDSTNLKGLAEPGNLTGVADTGGTSSSIAAIRSAAGTAPEGPFRIDARDMLARNGHPEKAFVPGALLPGNWVLEGYGE